MLQEKNMRFGDYTKKKWLDDPRGLTLSDMSKVLGISLSDDVRGNRLHGALCPAGIEGRLCYGGGLENEDLERPVLAATAFQESSYGYSTAKSSAFLPLRWRRGR